MNNHPVSNMTRPRPETSQSEERSRAEDRSTIDQTYGILRTTPSEDRTNSSRHDPNRPGVDIQESHQANSQLPLLPGRSTNDHVDTQPHTSSFTHLRRNAVSEGMPEVNYRIYTTSGLSAREQALAYIYRTGGLPTREPAQGVDLERHYPAQVSPANSLTSSTESVLNGGDTDEDDGDNAVRDARLVTAGIRGKQRRSDDDVGRSPKRQG